MSLRGIAAAALLPALAPLGGCIAALPDIWAVPTRAASSAEAFDRDRKAILAMAGEFAVTFRFDETVALREGYKLREPQRASATELVEVVRDTGRHIVLQHILVLGDAHQVVKHWRQDWTYEDREIWAFRGKRLWERVRVPASVARGQWSQAVFEVDDRPRYQGIGGWRHEGEVSIWTSSTTWRPLPRREYTKRDDYEAIEAVNRHIITPTGWAHEQDNSKLDLDDASGRPMLAKEYGLNTYRRISDYDFSTGRAYWRRTAPFWAEVRDEWAQRMQEAERLFIRESVDEDPLIDAVFTMAESLLPRAAEAERRRAIHDAVAAYFDSRG